MFTKRTVRDIAVGGKTVLMRADFNVPLSDGKIADDYRILQALPTIRYLLENNAKLVLCSHLGRPSGPNDTSCSLWPVAIRLQELLGKDKVSFAKDCVGDEVKKAASGLKSGQVLLLENLRFHPEEEQNDAEFAKNLVTSTGAELFVQDGFGVVHRAHASTEAITHDIPAVSGLLLE
jgi:3-phosphoglycerate kinase